MRAAVDAGALAVLTDSEGAGLCADAGVPVFVVEGPRQVLGDVAARLYGRPADELQMLGITGTNGKTTVASMVESGLRAAGRTTGLIGTVGMRVAGEAYPGARTTPEATDLHAALAVMRERGVQSVVMEVSSIAVEERRIDGVRYDVAAFTNLSQDHLDYHGTMEDYFAAKARLFTADRAQLGHRRHRRRVGPPAGGRDPHTRADVVAAGLACGLACRARRAVSSRSSDRTASVNPLRRADAGVVQHRQRRVRLRRPSCRRRDC